jgi:PAS domain S-box-containing protein
VRLLALVFVVLLATSTRAEEGHGEHASMAAEFVAKFGEALAAMMLAAASVRLTGAWTVAKAWRHERRWNRMFLRSMKEKFGADPATALRTAIVDTQNDMSITAAKIEALGRFGNMALFMADQQGRLEWVSPAMCDLFGMDAAELLGFGATRALRDASRHFEEWIFSVKNGTAYRDVYVVENQRTGTEIECEAEAYEYHDREGAIRWFIGYVRPTGGAVEKS